MKRFILVLLSLSLAFCFALAACKTERGDGETPFDSEPIDDSLSENGNGADSRDENDGDENDGDEKTEGEIKPLPDSGWSLGEIQIGEQND